MGPVQGGRGACCFELSRPRAAVRLATSWHCRLGLAGDSCHRGRPLGPAFLRYTTLSATTFTAGKSATASVAQKSVCGVCQVCRAEQECFPGVSETAIWQRFAHRNDCRPLRHLPRPRRRPAPQSRAPHCRRLITKHSFRAWGQPSTPAHLPMRCRGERGRVPSLDTAFFSKPARRQQVAGSVMIVGRKQLAEEQRGAPAGTCRAHAYSRARSSATLPHSAMPQPRASCLMGLAHGPCLWPSSPGKSCPAASSSRADRALVCRWACRLHRLLQRSSPVQSVPPSVPPATWAPPAGSPHIPWRQSQPMGRAV